MNLRKKLNDLRKRIEAVRLIQLDEKAASAEDLYEKTYDPLIVKVFVPDENRIFIHLIEEEYGWILQNSIENVNRLTCDVEFVTSNQIDSTNYRMLPKTKETNPERMCFIERNSAVGKRILEIIKVSKPEQKRCTEPRGIAGYD